jgi:hypothetical protein
MSFNNEKVVGISKEGRIHVNEIHKILIKAASLISQKQNVRGGFAK